VCRIVADLFERRSGVLEALERVGMHVDVQLLAAGDYRLEPDVLVERKATVDFHLSVQRGRLWRQIRALRDGSEQPYLIIEGESLDASCLSPNGARGACLAVLGQGVAVLRTRDPDDSARWLRLLALRRQHARLGRDRPVYAQRLQPSKRLVNEAMLAAVPGVSVVRARALLKEFKSVRAVVNADYDALLAVPGVGPAVAEALRTATN
jgi:ERCC4-type nuclease